jgi:hypothetical protein
LTPELVFSEPQLQRQWFKGFVHGIHQRVIRREITVDPVVLSRLSLPYTPAEGSPRGRKPEKAYVIDAAHLERRLCTAIEKLEKHGQPATRPRVAQELCWSLSTLHRYCHDLHVDFEECKRRVREGRT